MKAEDKVIEYLLDAHSKETALVQTLTAHLKVAEPSDYRALIEDHRDQTIEHARMLQQRLVELGGHRKPVAVAHAAMQNIITNSLAMAKAPVDMIRGKSVSEKMLKNARDEAMTEAAEIACYDSLEQLSTRTGDTKTAELARRIRSDEETMLSALRKEIPVLTDAVIDSQIPGVGAPWSGYDDMTAQDIKERLSGASPEVAEAVRTYEKAHKNRSTIIKTTQNELQDA